MRPVLLFLGKHDTMFCGIAGIRNRCADKRKIEKIVN